VYCTPTELDLQLPMQSVPITTKVVSLNPVHGKVYSVHDVIKFVSDVRQVSGFLYERGQGIRMSQNYGRCRNGKGRLRQKWVGRGDPKWVRKKKVKGSRYGWYQLYHCYIYMNRAYLFMFCYFYLVFYVA
jgi:hypothetical protein